MEKPVIPSVKEKMSLDFLYFPAFAAFILHNELENFTAEITRLYEETDIPLLRFFKSMPIEQRHALAVSSQRELLTHITANDASAYIEKSIHSWLTNEIPAFTREQVLIQDITLVSFVRRKVFRKFVLQYTQDHALCLKIIEEIDRFTAVLDSEVFSSYLSLQQEKINSINTALQKREQQLLEAQAIGQIGSFEWDFQGKGSAYTPEMFKIFEMDAATNLDSFLDYVHADEREKVRIAIDKAMIDGEYECEYRYKRNNKEKIIYSRGRVQFADGKPLKMIGTVSDVTERHSIIQKLRESEKLHKQAQALTHLGNWSWEVNSNKITWSDEMYRIYGLEPQSEEITYQRFLSFVAPEDKAKRIAEIQRSLETLQVAEYHFRIKTADGIIKVLRGKGEIINDQQKKSLMMLGTCQDVTHEFALTEKLKEREKYLEKLNESLEYANDELSRTNQELESFNFVASHDLQEPLRKIQVYSDRIMEITGGNLDPPLRQYFEKINQASNRMQKLIEDFLSFSQTITTTLPPEEVDLNEMLKDIRVELSNVIEAKNAIITASRLPVISGIPFQVKQLLTNLLSNALKYTEPGIPPRITITSMTVKASEMSFVRTPVASRYSKISIADNGIGFEEKYAEKIFGMFQRLHSKDTYSGTGIGLALCRKIIQNMNGFITVKSHPGKGSVFMIFIPKKG